MRIRTVKPELWEDETLGCVSRDARLLFIATFNLADDEGLLRWNPSYIKSQVFMYDEDLDEAGVSKIMAELTDAGVIFPYIGGKSAQRLAIIPNFRKHQQINRPQRGKLPPPPLQSLEVIRMYARRDEWRCHVCGGYIPTEQQTAGDRQAVSIDHVTPRSRGGSDYPTNVRAAHVGCNNDLTSSNAETDLFTDSFTESGSEPLTDSFTGGKERKGREGKGRECVGDPPTPAPAPTESKPRSVEWQITDSIHQRDPLIKFIAVQQIVKRALTAYPPPAVQAALHRLLDANRPISTETLRIELNGGQRRAGPQRHQNPEDQSIYDAPMFPTTTGGPA